MSPESAESACLNHGSACSGVTPCLDVFLLVDARVFYSSLPGETTQILRFLWQHSPDFHDPGEELRIWGECTLIFHPAKGCLWPARGLTGKAEVNEDVLTEQPGMSSSAMGLRIARSLGFSGSLSLQIQWRHALRRRSVENS